MANVPERPEHPRDEHHQCDRHQGRLPTGANAVLPGQTTELQLQARARRGHIGHLDSYWLQGIWS